MKHSDDSRNTARLSRDDTSISELGSTSSTIIVMLWMGAFRLVAQEKLRVLKASA